MIEETGARYPACRCESLPDGLELAPGIYVEDLWMLGAGCCSTLYNGPGWVCPRLDAVRRRYHK